MPHKSVRSALVCLLLVVLLAGCGSDRPETVPVTGTVHYQGAPVAEADVMFTPTAGRTATGRTDAEGRFTLMTFQPGDGAVPGEHRVTVTKTEQIDDPRQPDSPYKQVRQVLPVRYGIPGKSPLTATVEADGENDFPLTLEP